ncbi:ComEA family DNA-binding protein [Arthrobacter citreus]|uniref:ComEA family DNA-binding protein n=1 Tax=Arthrobacter citreus TaxID=1670 RepID=UPI0036D8B12F
MANHRWDTEPTATLPSRLVARRRAVTGGGMDGARWPGSEPSGYGGESSLFKDGEAWVLPGQVGPDPDGPDGEGAEPASDSFEGGPRREGRSGQRRRWRFPLGAGILAACLMLAAAAAVPLLRGREAVLAVELGSSPAAGESTSEEEPAADGLQQPGDGASSEPEPAGGVLVVHVAGAVAAPGLVRIPEGARVADAVAAAGGASGEADLTRVNLAAPMTDGSMVVIPAEGDPPAGAVTAPSGAVGSTAPNGTAGQGGGSGGPAVNLNTADESELQTLPRVGPVLADRIIAWRTEHGPFQRPEDLDAVPGIGEAMLAALLPLIAV